MPRPSPIGASRFGRVGAYRQATGLAPHELQVVIAVMACERAHDGFPVRDAIAAIAEVDDVSMPSRLVRSGWLETAGRVVGNVVAYRATAKAWRVLGFGRARAA